MRLTQEKFNEIIDLLGAACSARLLEKALSFAEKNEVEYTEATKKALNDYIGDLTKLYHDSTELPKVFLEAYEKAKLNLSSFSSSSFGKEKSETTTSYLINVKAISAQLNTDFNQNTEDNGELELFSPLNYTGTAYKFDSASNAIYSSTATIKKGFDQTAANHASPNDPQHPLMQNPSFFMQLMSHPATYSAVGLVLFLAGIAVTCALGAIVLGILLVGAGAVLSGAGYVASKSGFFSQASKPEVPANQNAQVSSPAV